MSTPGPDADGSTSPDRPSCMWKADRRFGGLPVHGLSPSRQTAADIRRELEVKEAGGCIWMGQYENEDWNRVASMSDPDVRQRLLAALDEGRLRDALGMVYAAGFRWALECERFKPEHADRPRDALSDQPDTSDLKQRLELPWHVRSVLAGMIQAARAEAEADGEPVTKDEDWQAAVRRRLPSKKLIEPELQRLTGAPVRLIRRIVQEIDWLSHSAGRPKRSP